MTFVDKMDVEITQADIDGGHVCQSSTCPMSNAVNRLLPDSLFSCTYPYYYEEKEGVERWEWRVDIMETHGERTVASYIIDADTCKSIENYDDCTKPFSPRMAHLTKVEN